MEVSSHALMQARVRGVEFDVAVFTNLTQDHLDYHKTMDAYFEAKARLFSGLKDQPKKKEAQAVINLDDRYGAILAQRFSKEIPVITYGVGVHADFRASNVRIDFNGTSYQLDAQGKSYLVRLPLIGQFNVYNSLAAIARPRSWAWMRATACSRWPMPGPCPAASRRFLPSASSAFSLITRTPTTRCSTSSGPAAN